MHECVVRLLRSSSDEESLECFAGLITTTGKDLDKPEAKVASVGTAGCMCICMYVHLCDTECPSVRRLECLTVCAIFHAGSFTHCNTYMLLLACHDSVDNGCITNSH